MSRFLIAAIVALVGAQMSGAALASTVTYDLTLSDTLYGPESGTGMLTVNGPVTTNSFTSNGGGLDSLSIVIDGQTYTLSNVVGLAEASCCERVFDKPLLFRSIRRYPPVSCLHGSFLFLYRFEQLVLVIGRHDQRSRLPRFTKCNTTAADRYPLRSWVAWLRACSLEPAANDCCRTTCLIGSALNRKVTARRSLRSLC